MVGRPPLRRPDLWSQMLTDCRLESGLTQAKVCATLGLSRNHLCAIETAKISPSVRTLDRILKLYGYELDIVKST